jgi:hypothetical protein
VRVSLARGIGANSYTLPATALRLQQRERRKTTACLGEDSVETLTSSLSLSSLWFYLKGGDYRNKDPLIRRDFSGECASFSHNFGKILVSLSL